MFCGSGLLSLIEEVDGSEEGDSSSNLKDCREFAIGYLQNSENKFQYKCEQK